MARLSFSKISTYQNCPLSYKFQYVDKLPTEEKWYFSFGSTLHLCAEHFFRVKVPPPPSHAELLSFYDEAWRSGGYESVEEEERYRAYGRQVMTRFWELHNADFRPPLAVERNFSIDIEGVSLRGVIDRVDKLGNGLSILDYKTNQQLFTKEYVADNLQLTLYQMAAGQLWQLPVEKLTLYHLRSNTACSCGARTEQQLEAARGLVLEVAESIERQQFPAVENTFCPCDYARYCPYHRHKYLPVRQEPPGEETLPAVDVGEAVEEYVSLQGKIKELEAQLKDIRQAITEYCQVQGLNRVYGRENAITYKQVARTGFNEDEVRALLEPLGLWQGVLGLDRARLEQLLSDETVSGELKEKLEALRKVISQSPHLWVRRLAEEE
jgi:RecB family exonuclease